jgi:DNA-binding transcriptional ArsR family regulator
MPAATQFGTLLREIPNKFTHREQEIAALVAQGLTRREIAQRLGLSISTVSRHVRNILRKLEAKTPPLDPAFYERLWAVPGFSEAAVTFLERLRNPQLGSRSSEVRRTGLVRENAGDLTRIEAAKANRDRAILLAQHLKDLARFAASGEQHVMEVAEHLAEHLREVTEDLPSQVQPLGEALPEELQAYFFQLIARSFTEAMTMLPELGLAAIARAPMHAPQAAPLPGEVEEAAPEHYAKSLPDISDHAIILPPMPPNKVEDGDHLTKHINDLQSQAKLGSETKQRPLPYPHENVVFHAAQLRAETLRRQRTKRDTVKSYEVVATLRDAAERAGVADGEILTTSEIEAEYSINRKLVHEYTKRGRRGRPHLTPLSVRLGGERGGSAQLLFRRGDIERIVANPPKTGRPRK